MTDRGRDAKTLSRNQQMIRVLPKKKALVIDTAVNVAFQTGLVVQ